MILIDHEKILIDLLNIFLHIIESNKGVPVKDDERFLDAEGLALKYFGHTLASLYIWRGISIENLEIPIIKFLDPSSFDVLVRAAFETYLIFNHIFINSKNKVEEDLRYYSWEVSGLYSRQDYPATLKENISKLLDEKIYIETIIQKIKENSLYKSYCEKDRDKYLNKLKRSNWREKGYIEMAQEAGLSRRFSKYIYRFLCEHSHSGIISVTQVRQSKDSEQRRILMEGSIGHLIICLAFMIRDYTKYFPKSNEYYRKQYPEPNLVNFWVDVGATDEI